MGARPTGPGRPSIAARRPAKTAHLVQAQPALGVQVVDRDEPLFPLLVAAAVVRVIDVPPVAGAALLGLDYVNAPPAAASRLRAAYGLARP